MEYVIQAIKVSKNLVHAGANARAPKTGFFAVFLIQTQFFTRSLLILCMLTWIFALITTPNLQVNSQSVYVIIKERPLGISLRICHAKFKHA